MPTISTIALAIAFVALLVVAGCLLLLCILHWSRINQKLSHITSHIARSQEVQPNYGFLLYYARVRADGLGAVKYGAVQVADPATYLLCYKEAHPDVWLIALAVVPLDAKSANLAATVPALPDGV